MTDPTNTQRGKWATVALEAYSAEKHEVLDETTISDLLADLRHYCHQADVDFDEANRIAEDHYAIEQGGAE